VDPLWAELINSDWHDYRGGGGREDRIENPTWLSQFLTRCGVAPRPLPGPAGREEVRRLRALLKRAVKALMAGGKPRKADLEALNARLAAAPVRRRVVPAGDRFEVVLVPTAGRLAHVLGETAASFVELLANGDPTRIKICGNRDCGWVMVDESRNRTRRWCESAGCGNLMKVRRYRERHRRPTRAKARARHASRR
jgi:predicted RNA-binding Zn ribbon-like protein